VGNDRKSAAAAGFRDVGQGGFQGKSRALPGRQRNP